MKECNLYYCDCVNENRQCWNCNHCKNPDNKSKTEDHYVSYLDQANKIYEYLQGNLPEGFTCFAPKLKPKQAFSVLWFLQEGAHCIVDHIEQCRECLDLFDSDSEGFYLDDQYEVDGKTLAKKHWGHWCDSCAPDVEFMLK